MTYEEYKYRYRKINTYLLRCGISYFVGVALILICFVGLSYYLDASFVTEGTQMTFTLAIKYSESFWVMFFYSLMSLGILVGLVFLVMLFIALVEATGSHLKNKKELVNELDKDAYKQYKRGKTLKEVI